MMWREPRNWRFSAHMPDDLFKKIDKILASGEFVFDAEMWGKALEKLEVKA